MSIRAVIWDIGGVLVRTEDWQPRNQLAEELGLERSELNDLVFGKEAGKKAQLGEISPEQLWAYIGGVLKLDELQLDRFKRQFFAGDQVDQRLVDVIRTLRQQYKSGVISNAWEDLRSVMEKYWKIADAFDVIVISGEEGRMKPDLKIFETALERLEIQPGEGVFIDDVQHNVQAAQAAGLHAIHFRSPEQVLGELGLMLGRQL